MSIASEEEQSLLSNNGQVNVYSNANDDPFTFRASQMAKKRVRRGVSLFVYIENTNKCFFAS